RRGLELQYRKRCVCLCMCHSRGEYISYWISIAIQVGPCPRQVMTGEPPFANLRNEGSVLTAVVVHDQRPARPTNAVAEQELRHDMWDLMQDCWKRQPEARPNMSALLSRLAPLTACSEELPSSLSLDSGNLSSHLK